MKLTLTQFSTELETYIDRYSIESLMTIIADICRAKAEHLRSNWQDENQAQEWDDKAEKIDALA